MQFTDDDDKSASSTVTDCCYTDSTRTVTAAAVNWSFQCSNIDIDINITTISVIDERFA